MSFDTVGELFTFNRWADDRLLNIAADLPAKQLDRPFAIGPGSIRRTLKHIYGAARTWHARVGAPEHATVPRARDISAINDLFSAARGLANARDDWLSSLDDADVERAVTYCDSEGNTRTNRLGDILLHVCNHGVHHRAQVLNMLRHVGAKPPWLDYLAMKWEQPDRPAPDLDLSTIRRYQVYGDWAFRRVLAAAEPLSDALLDRPIDMGLGSLRKTLVHIRDAEQWWLRNWREGPTRRFPVADDSAPLAELGRAFDDAARQRDAYCDSLTDEDMKQRVSAQIGPDRTVTFSLGESLLQLCGHGTHHRAQALNMLRQVGAETPQLNYTVWIHRPA